MRIRAWRPLAGAALLAAPALAQQVDMAEIARWSDARIVQYRIDGVYSGWTAVSHEDAASQGAVGDTLGVELVWDLRAHALVGPPKLANGPSRTARTRNQWPPCPAPLLKGEYEHFTASEATAGDGQDRVRILGTRSFPAASIGKQCPASNALSPSPAKQAPAELWLALPNPTLLALPDAAAGGARVSADRKTFTLSGGGWTWTYTPTRVK